MRLRWPLKKYTNGRPIDLINFELKAALLAAGYAVVTIDVRGTGLCQAQLMPPHKMLNLQQSLQAYHCTSQACMACCWSTMSMRSPRSKSKRFNTAHFRSGI